jgi:hypothetical protein
MPVFLVFFIYHSLQPVIAKGLMIVMPNLIKVRGSLF